MKRYGKWLLALAAALVLGIVIGFAGGRAINFTGPKQAASAYQVVVGPTTKKTVTYSEGSSSYSFPNPKGKLVQIVYHKDAYQLVTLDDAK
ncbi:hypothetical protein [Lacticaseibacillus mingshuiensis]|uniref:Uncharacterized protein n=1 Tax=Lacticaseibacillus mingshuiensis TaxID=2799574 RepID=A0ABW4CFP1_9LACO|nr:hypothetical protein [Lacticaseibacillus mingshuiensis]